MESESVDTSDNRASTLSLSLQTRELRLFIIANPALTTSSSTQPSHHSPPHHPALAVIFAYPSHLAPSARFDFSNIDRISPPLIALP